MVNPAVASLDSDASSFVLPHLDMFGNDDLLAAHIRGIDDVLRLIARGTPVTGNAICGACDYRVLDDELLGELLAAGGDPNARRPVADSSSLVVENGWWDCDLVPVLGRDKREWYPIQYAADSPLLVPEEADASKRQIADVMTALLHYNADIYATCKQPLWHVRPYPFPGEGHSPAASRLDEAEQEQREASVWDPRPGLYGIYDGDRQRNPAPECGYGLRCVAHSIFEDGGYLVPLLQHPGLDLEHRDPQGRTLIHSACRSAVGADAIFTTIHSELDRPNNQELIAEDFSETSIFSVLRERGADLTAVDFTGKTVLHHLYEARDGAEGGRQPWVHNSLRYILKNVPSLINRPDRYGNYPLHSALQRMRDSNAFTMFIDDVRKDPQLSAIQDLLDAGADPTATDSRGNTAMHYLVESGLAEQEVGNAIRILGAAFCREGTDVNACNAHGRTALELLMDDDDQLRNRRLCSDQGHRDGFQRRPQAEIDEEVLGILDENGARWLQLDSQGRSLLHVLAKHPTAKAVSRTKYLLGKGVDPHIEDGEGKTAADVAIEFDNASVLDSLRQSGY